MISLEDRHRIVQVVYEAQHEGARLHSACEVVGISLRTLQRWSAGDGLTHGDKRPTAEHPMVPHALTAEERAAVLNVANEPRFADMPPARIVPMLADEGIYMASESTVQRILRDAGQNKHRTRSKVPQAGRVVTTHIANGPRQVWCWDMTYLPSKVIGQWFYLYLIVDLYSRMVVGWDVQATDDSQHAVKLLQRVSLSEGVHGMKHKPVLHGDNGSTLKATTVLAMLHWLDVKPSYSRPRVSNDNAFVESLFKTAKYRPEFPTAGFASLEAARKWAGEFVHWYNHVHRHSGIRYVTPAQRHCGEDRDILKRRHQLYLSAREKNPKRWSGDTRDWSYIEVVTLNPDRDNVIEDQLRRRDKNPVAA